MEYLSSLLAQPIQPLLDWIKSLMTAEINIHLFSSIWGIVIYILSLFYGILLLYAGFNFMISGYDVVKREQAKAWLRNILIMMVLVQSSYFLYEMAIELNAAMTTGVFSMINPQFFQLTTDNLTSFALQLAFTFLYTAVLLVTLLLLVFRYIFVSMGVIFFPLAIFLSFIPMFKDYGEALLHILLSLVFMGFLQSLILLGGSMLLSVGIFQQMQIVVMTCTFLLVIIATVLTVQFAATKSFGVGTMTKVIAKII